MLETSAEVETRLLVQGRLWLSLRGAHTAESFAPMEASLERALTTSPDGKAHVFIDALQLLDFSPEFRDRCVLWFGTHRRWLHRVVVLQNSPLLRVALSTLNVATGGLVETTSSRADFERSWWAR